MKSEKLSPGDEIRIVTPSRSLSMISEVDRRTATDRFEAMGLKVTFGKHVLESDDFVSSSIKSRVEDLHEAFLDPKVKAISSVIGGFNSNQLLRSLDYELIRKNPKILVGYSDITALSNAIYAKTGLITFSGPHYSTFGMVKGMEYTTDYFQKCLFGSKPIQVSPATHWSDDAWFLDQDNRDFIENEGYWALREGVCQGTIIGGNMCTFNLLHGTEFMPDIRNSVLFLEDDMGSNPLNFDRDLQSVIHQPGFDQVKGLVIGRFQKVSKVTRSLLEQIVYSKPELKGLPILANVDFGHTSPMFTLPIGGKAAIVVDGEQSTIELSDF